VGLARRTRPRLVRRPGVARPRPGRPVHHGRRADLRRARTEPRGQRRAPGPRPSLAGLRDRVSGPPQPGLRRLRPADRRLRRGEDPERARNVAGGDPGLLPRPPRRRALACAARGRAGGLAPLARLHRHGHDGERLLPRLPRRRARLRAHARAPDTRAAASAARGDRSRVRDPRAGGRARAGGADGSAPARALSPGEGRRDAAPVSLAVRRGAGRRPRRRRGAARARPLALRPLRRVQRRGRLEVRAARGAPLLPLPRRRARPLPRDRPARRDDRPRREGALARRAAPGAPGGGALRRLLARARGLGVRLRLRAADPGAERLRRRAALPRAPGGVGRAESAAPWSPR
jgi:hypothetical protein